MERSASTNVESWVESLMMRMLMIVIIGAMIASILGILAIKPFDRGSDAPPPVIQQPEPNSSSTSAEVPRSR
ncbi:MULTISPECIES: hypothetical protein [Rhizobium]|jgi:hypothetical protein|uniref:hypothetical protein n=2 Tax=Rhizobium/Agrobacterium group TaxID=227290 RepID=UPI000F4DAF2F|nr:MULTISPECIES: hypothetical protein [Rhizobium]